jgi:glycosyltransferase involved in cell wall biosynthesis
MALVQVFISTYNRPEFILKSVQSALNQNFNSFEVVVSDNSTNNKTKDIISKIDNNRLIYKKRNPSLNVFDHFNAILNDVSSDYFVIFHDDDIMHSQMLNTLHKAFHNETKTIAIGANAIKINNNVNTNSTIYKSFKRTVLLRNPLDVLKQYSTRYGIVPFSSYMYKLEVSKKLKFDSLKAGKYSDVAFISELTTLGNIKLLNQPVMDYYIHNDQDSAKFSYAECSNLVKYFCATTKLSRKHKYIMKFRIQNIYSLIKYNLSVNKSFLFSKKYLKLIKIIVNNLNLNHIFRIFIFSLKSLKNILINFP